MVNRFAINHGGQLFDKDGEALVREDDRTTTRCGDAAPCCCGSESIGLLSMMKAPPEQRNYGNRELYGDGEWQVKQPLIRKA